LETDGFIRSGSDIGLDIFNKSVRELRIVRVEDKEILLVAINNDKVQLYELIK
jgi:hypothetical protein